MKKDDSDVLIIGGGIVGSTLALLLGNPLAAWLGQSLDWRYVYGFVGLISVATLAMVICVLPVDHQEQRKAPFSEIRAFNRAGIWFALAIGAIGFAGMFAVFSYLAPTLLEVTRVDPAWIPVALVVFGVVGWTFTTDLLPKADMRTAVASTEEAWSDIHHAPGSVARYCCKVHCARNSSDKEHAILWSGLDMKCHLMSPTDRKCFKGCLGSYGYPAPWPSP